MVNKFLKYSVLALSVSTLLSGCGGSGGGGNGNSNNPQTPTTVSGRAIDGPLSGATVSFSTCDDTVVTDGEGDFTIPAGCSGQITIVGGIDTITSVPFNGQLKGTTSTTGESIVSPLTTLVENLAGDQAAIASLASSLGLSVEQLKSDPMDNKVVYEKAVAVQMMLDEVSKNIDALGSSLTPAQISATAASKLSTALKDSTGGPAALSSPTLITSVLTSTLSDTSIVTSLASVGVTATNVADVASNLASLTTSNISSKISDAQTAIQNATSTAPAALTAASTAMSEYKNDPVVSNLVAGLAQTLITTNPATATAALQTLSTAITTPQPTVESINTALEGVAETSPAIIPAEKLTEIKEKVASFHENYYELLGFNIGNPNDITPYALTNSLTNTPLTAAPTILNNLKFGVKAHGSYAAINATQNFKVALSVVTNEGDYLNVTASKLTLSFDGTGALTNATIPTDSVVVAASSNQNLVATSNSRAQVVSAFNSGKVNLTSTTLNSIFPGISNQLAGFNLTNRTVTVTGILSPIGTNTNAIIAADKKSPTDTTAKYAVSTAYNVGSTAGAGFKARFTITP